MYLRVFHARTCTHIYESFFAPISTEIAAPAHMRKPKCERTLTVC